MAELRASVQELLEMFGQCTVRRGKVRKARNRVFPPMKMTRSAIDEIMKEIGGRPPERGGVLIGPQKENMVTNFVFDETGKGDGTYWTFGRERLNEILRQYLPLGLDCKGYVHSHPPGYRRLSSGDMRIPGTVFGNPKNSDLEQLWMPIVVDGDIMPFIIFRDDPARAIRAELVVL